MDIESENAVRMLGALGDLVPHLDLFNYNLYRQLRAPSRVPCRSVGFSGHPFRIHRGSEVEQFERALLLGCAVGLDSKNERCVIFEVILAWNQAGWFVHATTEEEDHRRENITRTLWKSTEYRAHSLSDAISALHQAEAELEASVIQPAVAEVLDEIQPA